MKRRLHIWDLLWDPNNVYDVIWWPNSSLKDFVAIFTVSLLFLRQCVWRKYNRFWASGYFFFCFFFSLSSSIPELTPACYQSNSLIFPPFIFIRALLIAICFILYYLLGWNFLSIWSLFGFFSPFRHDPHSFNFDFFNYFLNWIIF